MRRGVLENPGLLYDAVFIPVGSVVSVTTDDGARWADLVKKENSTPEPGLITWHFDDGSEMVVAADEVIRVRSMPKP